MAAALQPPFNTNKFLAEAAFGDLIHDFGGNKDKTKDFSKSVVEANQRFQSDFKLGLPTVLDGGTDLIDEAKVLENVFSIPINFVADNVYSQNIQNGIPDDSNGTKDKLRAVFKGGNKNKPEYYATLQSLINHKFNTLRDELTRQGINQSANVGKNKSINVNF